MNCGVCQIGVMTGYRLEKISYELWCVSDWCDNWLQLGSVRFELRCVSDLYDDCLQARKYKV